MNSVNVLIISEDVVFTSSLRRLLLNECKRVKVFECATLSNLRTFSKILIIDLIVLDDTIIGTSEHEVISYLRNEKKTNAAVYFFSSTESEEMALAKGANFFFKKPFSPDEVISHIKSNVGKILSYYHSALSMEKISFDIPDGLRPFVRQFRSDKGNAIQNLKNFLQIWETDAVGYFILSLFYHKNNQADEAMHHALKAKTFAPGSPLLEHLPYYLAHPNQFDAWNSFTASFITPVEEENSPNLIDSPLDLDHIIDSLSDEDLKNSSSAGKGSVSIEKADNNESEMQAKIYEEQGKHLEAIQILKKLKQRMQEKTKHYENEIRRLLETSNNN